MMYSKHGKSLGNCKFDFDEVLLIFFSKSVLEVLITITVRKIIIIK